MYIQFTIHRIKIVDRLYNKLIMKYAICKTGM